MRILLWAVMSLSWVDELYNVYETQCGDEKMLKVAHSTANTQIEVTITENGDFVTARALSKDEGRNTVIPVTEASGGRTSGIIPRPFSDKLKYIAGDYQKYTDDDNSKHFSLYIKQLEGWKDSEYTHPAVNAVYSYLSKKSIISDILKITGIFELNNSGMLSDSFKIASIPQKDAFVRFIVHYSDSSRISKTWLDTTLYESFIQYNKSFFDTAGLCYATGEVGPLTENHPSKIRNSGDMAKLISANDESGFTYRGRFRNKSEAVSVGYDFSQKMHNALKWLIERQGKSYWNAFSKRPFITWQRIEEQLNPYLNKLGDKRVRYEKMLQDIKGKFTPESFADNTALSPLYLLGFHHYTADIFTSKKKEEN